MKPFSTLALAALAVLLLPIFAMADSPSPSFKAINGNSMPPSAIGGKTVLCNPGASAGIISGCSPAAVAAIMNSYIPNWSANVEGTGTAGIDGGHWFIWNSPSAIDTINTLRVDRSPTYTGGSAGNLSAIWANCSVGANVANYEWCQKITLDNHAMTSAQNVGLNVTSTRYSNSSPTWATNFVCQQTDGVANPGNGCIGSEYDIYVDGTDNNKQRIGLQMVVGTGSGSTTAASAHAYAAFWLTPQNTGVWDHIMLAQPGNYGNGIDFGGVSFSGYAIGLAGNAKFAIDANSSGAYNRYFTYNSGVYVYNTPSGVALQVADNGKVVAGTSGSTGAILQLTNSSGICTHTPGSSSETVSCTSDERTKHDIVDAKPALDDLSSMRIRDFVFNATGEKRVGVIAQEMLQAHPDMVHKGQDGFYTVDEPNPWILIKGLQELKADNDNIRMELRIGEAIGAIGLISVAIYSRRRKAV